MAEALWNQLGAGRWQASSAGTKPAGYVHPLALEALTEPCEVDLFTDSTYLRDGITKWIKAWKARGWMTTTKQPVKNEDLWRALDAAAARHRVHWRWLKGHAGHAGNERCDVLATAAIEGIKKRFTREQLRHAVAALQAARAPGAGQSELFI